MSAITVEQARAALVQAVEQRGADYVYPRTNVNDGCVYAENDQPSCIVGQVVYNIDPDLFARLAQEEAKHYNEGLGGTSVLGITSIEFEEVAREALNVAQAFQDTGATWGEALKQFDALIAEEETKED